MFGMKKPPVLKIILILWLAFASVYVVYNEYTRIKIYVAKAAYTRGVQDSVTQLMAEAAKCQPIPVTANDQRIDLIALSCLTQPSENGESAEE